MKPILTTLILLSASSSFSQESLKPNCVTLEGSGSDSLITSFPSNVIAVSKDRQLLASYDHFWPKNQALFRLWDTQTGKLLRKIILGNYSQHNAAALHFSPENRFVYMQGWTDIANRTTGKMKGVPFWDLTNNQIVMSPCYTMEGVSTVAFSHDQKVAYVVSVGENDHSLCSTQENKLFAHIKGREHFDPETQQLFENFSNKDYPYFHQLNEKLKQSAANKNVTLYKPKVSREWLKSSASHIRKLPAIPAYSTLKTQRQPQTNQLRIPGGYATDEEYRDANDVYKFDQYLFVSGKEKRLGNHFFLLNWKTGKGEAVKLPANTSSPVAHWVPKSQQLILTLSDGSSVNKRIVSYNIQTKQMQTVYKADGIFEMESVTSAQGKPELQFLAYNEQAKKNYSCRL